MLAVAHCIGPNTKSAKGGSARPKNATKSRPFTSWTEKQNGPSSGNTLDLFISK